MILGTVAATAIAAGSAGKPPIRVGFLAPLTGGFSQNGNIEAVGFNLGLKHFGSNVAGRKIEVYYADTQGDPNIALSQARQLVENRKVDVVEGPLVSFEIAAVSPYLAAKGIPTDDLSLCGYQQLLGYQKQGNAIDSGWTCDQTALMAGVWAAKAKHWKTAVVLSSDYAFGWLAGGAFSRSFERNGGKILKWIWAPVNTADYAPYVSQIPDVDVVFSTMSGINAVRYVNAYSDLGVKGKIPLLGILLTDYSVLPSENPNAALGTYVAMQYCDGIRSPENDTFVNMYHAKTGTWPAYYADAGWTKARILVNALKRTHGNTDPAKLIQAMKSVDIVAPRGPVRLNREFWTPIQNAYICQVKRVNGDLRNVPVYTYKNVQPWGALSKQEWLDHFEHDSAARPG